MGLAHTRAGPGGAIARSGGKVVVLCYVGGLLRGLPYRPNVTTSGRGKCSVLTGKPGRARANMRLLLAARCVHNQLAALGATAKRSRNCKARCHHVRVCEACSSRCRNRHRRRRSAVSLTAQAHEVTRPIEVAWLVEAFARHRQRRCKLALRARSYRGGPSEPPRGWTPERYARVFGARGGRGGGAGSERWV